MNAFRRIALAAAALVPLSPSLAQTVPPGPPVVGCGIVSGPPVAPQIRLQTPPFRPGAVARQGRGGSAGGGTVLVPGDPGSPLPPESVCGADIGAVIAGDAIAPGRIGLAMNLLGDGFHLTFLSLGSADTCTAGGGSGELVPVLRTSWSVDGSTLPLQLSQQPQADASGNRIDDGSASFWWQGYLYALAVPVAVPSRAGTETEAADSRQILLQAIAELAPGLDLSCFAQATAGSWSDLAALGIGDPRAAIPAGYSAADLQLSYLSAPSCASAAPADAEVSLFATFASAAGGSIGIGAWGLAGSAPYPGSIQDGLVAWASDRYQFTVYGYGGDGNPIPAGTLLPIARALDPAFSADCVLQPVVLTPADLPALAFHAPVAPDGWILTSSSLTGDVVGASCARPFDFRGTYALFWSFSSPEGLTVAASAYRVVTDHPGPRTSPVISDSCISWSDDRGTTFSVSGYSASAAAGPERSVLVAVAQSMDPGLTISN